MEPKTKMVLAWELHEQGISNSQIAKRLEGNREEVVQRDAIDFGSVFAFTDVDIFSREADVLLRPSVTAQEGLAFLH